MPSTYTLNNGIELIGTGEQSGTWGDTTNTNLELLDTALDGQVTITATSAGSSSSPNDLPISDGSASNGRNRMVIITSATDLGADVYYQLTPNDAEKIIYVRNDLNAQDLILFQGTYSASNDYVVPNGKTAVIFFDGAGTGAVAANVFNNAHFDALNVAGTSTFNDDVTFTGLNYNVIWDKSDNSFEFADNARVKFGNGSDLQIYHDGSDSFVKESGTGNLNLASNGTGVHIINDTDSETMATFHKNGAVTLYYDNAAKLATTSSGIDVTGTAVTDGLTSSGVLSVDAEAISQIKSGVASDILRLGNDSGTYVLGYASGLGSMDLGASDNFRIRHSSTESFRATPTGVVLNEIGASTVDFRVESDNVTNMLYVDGTNDRVGVATSPEARLHIRHGTYGDVTGGIQMEGGNQHHYWTLESATHSKFSIGSTAGQFSWVQSAGEMFRANGSGVIFNESAVASFDFRVEGSSDQNLIKADAGNNNVGIGVSPNASAKFHIDAGSTAGEYFRGGTNNRRHLFISSYDTGSLDAGHKLNANSVSGQIKLSANDVEHMRIDAVNVDTVFNETSQDMDFRVETDGASHSLFVDSTTGSVSVGGNVSSSSYYLNVVNSQRITGATASLLLNATNSGSGSHVASIDVQTLAERGSHMSLIDDDGVEYGIKRDYSGGSPITRAILYADDGTTQRRIMDWGKAGNYAVFNEEGNDMDFRVESAANTNAIFVDASADSVGILTNSVTGYDFNVAGNAAKLNSHIWTSRSYSVPTATDVDIYWNNANQALNTSYVYRWVLTTTGTGTDTGAIYHATYANGSWSLFIESRASTSSNSPQLKIDATTGKAQVFHNHPSTYSINVLGEAKYVGNNNNLGTAVGLASYWSHQWTQNGMIGNDSGSSSIDFRLESGNENAMLFLDADQDQVRLCTTAQLYTTTTPKLEVYDNSGTAGGIGVKLQSGTSASYAGYNYWGRVNGSGSTHYAFAFYDGPSGTSEGSITVTSSGTSYNTTSDHRLKENVVELTGATERLKQLEPKRFNFIKEGDTPTVDGFMAHEVQTVVPEAVTGTHNEVDDDGNPVYQGIDQAKLVPLLVATIKELEARITALENA